MAILGIMLLLSSFGPGAGDPSESTADIVLPLRLIDEPIPAQETPGGLQGAPVERQQDAQDVRRRDRDDDLIINVAARAQWSIPFGAADRSYYAYYGYYVVDHYLSWSDFFGAGWGYEVEIDIFFGQNGPGRRRTPGFNYGVALLIQTDSYEGQNVADDFGNRLDVGDMTATSIQICAKMVQTAGQGVYFDGMIGIGAVHYTEVTGTFSGLIFANEVKDTVFKDTWTFASTFRGDVGYRLGPLGFTLGMGFRIMAPPSEGGAISMSSGAFWTWDIDLGVELGF